MPAGKPVGKLPDGKSDVKPEVETSSESTEPNAQESVVQATEPAVEIDESDLKELQESKGVPYSRFKEINEQRKELETQLSNFKTSQEASLKRAQEDADLRAWARLQKERETEEDTSSLEPWEVGTRQLRNELASVRKELAAQKSSSDHQQLTGNIDRLAEKYPDADPLAVLGWKKSQPDVELEDLMQLSHNKNVERAEAKLNQILNNKKARQQKVLPVRDSAIRLKPEERPKSIRDAVAIMKGMLK